MSHVEAMPLPETYAGENLVFLIGAPRSGTTWLQRLLATDERVRTGRETDLFDLYVGPQLKAWRRELDESRSGRGPLGLGCYVTESDFLAALREYMRRFLEPMVGGLGPDEIFLDKTPSHALFVPEIDELLPRSRFIHIVRDGRDVVASLLAASRSWGRRWAPTGPRSATQMWLAHVRAGRAARELVGSERYHEIRYEDLFSRPEESLTGVVDYLGLEWSEEDLTSALAAGSSSAPSRPLPFGGEFARRERPAVGDPRDFIRLARPGGGTELSLLTKAVIWQLARRELERLGYARRTS